MGSLNGWTWVRAAICVLLTIFMVAPLAIIVVISFSSAPFLRFPPPGFSLQWYRSFFGNPVWLKTLSISVQVMIPAALGATTLGTMSAVGIARGRLPGASLIAGLLMAPFVVPVIITAAAIFGMFRAWNLYGTLLGLMIAHTVLTLPFVMATTLAAMRMVKPELEDAALTLGATHWSAFWRVTFPLILPAVLTGLLFSLVISFDELIVSLFISSPSVRPITVQMWSDIRGSVDPTIAAIATVLFSFSLFVMLIDHLYRRSSAKRALTSESS